MLNKIMLIGNLGRDPELQVTSDGTPFTRFSLAVSRNYKTSSGEKREETEWFNIVAWRQLAAQGVYIASNQASSFFYVFTGAHAVHLLGGVAALLFVLLRDFEKSQISVSMAAELTSYYWHFMDGLWIFLFALLYLGK